MPAAAPPSAPPSALPPRIDSLRARSTSAAMSPVNQNGSFEFDRVLKSGHALKRTRKTKQWKPVHLVLRPNLLSIYKDSDETKLRHQIALSDITAVARQKDSKKKMDHVFAIFSPARNYHFAAATDKDAQQWVALVRSEARIDDDEQDMVLMSPTGNTTTFTGFDRARPDNLVSSSEEPDPPPSNGTRIGQMHSARRPSHTLNYSGNEHGSFSDFSDTGGPLHSVLHPSAVSLPPTPLQHRNISQQSNIGATPDDERIICHGWLYVLKSKGGVRQWKKVWVVLRPKTLGLYKNDQEYSAHLVIPFATIIDAVDIDPPSKSKQYCMQVVSEEKSFRFAAANEESLVKWLGAFKSLLVKRKEAGQPRAHQTDSNNSGTHPPPKQTSHTPSPPHKSVAIALPATSHSQPPIATT